MRALILWFALAALVTACRVDVPHFEADDVGDDAAMTDAADTDAAMIDAPPNDGVIVDGPPIDADGLTELIGRNWTVAAGNDVLKCVRIQVPAETFITELRGIDPVGTHHTVLAISDAGTLGEFDCSIADVGADYRILFSSHGGGSQYTLPSGVAVRIEAGTYLTFTVHVQNSTADPISGRTSVRVRTTTTAPPMSQQASVLVAGDITLTVPGMTSIFTSGGGCTLQGSLVPTTVLAIAPHMHRFGTNLELTVTSGGTPSVVYDAGYDVNEQRSIPFTTPFSLVEGDALSVRCNYTNTGSSTVTFGESFQDEQCFVALLVHKGPFGLGVNCAN